MKLIKPLLTTALLISLAAGVLAVRAADKHDHQEAKANPYTLKTCVVSAEKLGEHGKPYVFSHAGQEIQLCCKDCRKDFDKDPGKYLKKIAAAQKSGGQK